MNSMRMNRVREFLKYPWPEPRLEILAVENTTKLVFEEWPR